MSTVHVEFEEPLASLLHETNQPVQAAVRELVVLELYRRGTVSSGKAAEILGMDRTAFIKHASGLGIAYISFTKDEWEAEKAASDAL